MASFASQISFVLLFLIFATTLNKSVITSERVIRCNGNDQRLLSIFKQGVIDPHNRLSSWTVEQDCCSWEGVYCNNITGRVTELSLSHHALRGEINVCVLQLEFLNHLDLSYNDFETVSMPPCQISTSLFDNQSLAPPSNHSASFSAALLHLDFSFNHELVINDLHWLSQLSSLKYLDLSYNDIRKETKELQHIAMLPSLSDLRLRGCEFSYFPSMDCVNFTSLEVLDLSFNIMKSKLPDSFFNITNHIYHLDFRGCNLYGQLPKALLNLQNLEYLDLSINNLEGTIPDWFGQYERLQYLNMGGNLFNGVIPSSLGNISSLFTLDLSSNQLSGNLPETLGQLHSLNKLHIRHNFLMVGVLTEKNFWNLSNLTSLDLRTTSFEFDIDPKWTPPFQLEYLNLANTSIGPKLPTWLYTQRSLSYLDISTSRISKVDADVFWTFIVGIDYADISNNMISDDISNVTLSRNISYFDASHNSLSGSVLSVLCHLESNGESMLYHLDLSYNHLSGELPDCWANLNQVAYLNLGSNKLTGKVPPSLASLNPFLLDLSDNSFFGEFSIEMMNWTSLEYLILDKNNFSGGLPNPYMAQNLAVIKLRSNQFTGNIPTQLCNFTILTVLDLGENRLSGSIPHCLHNIKDPIGLTFWPNEITIFSKGRELDYKTYLLPLLKSGFTDLSANSLSGEIPKELFSITQMHSLNLSRNHLTGKIPKRIGGMKNLESLDLSYNNFSGEIPSTISNLSFLQYLNLSYNNFIGKIPLGTQIQSFDSWSFVGNGELCGDPLPKKCNKKEETHDPKLDKRNEDDNFLKSLYLGMGVGFAAGFWGVCGSLFLVRPWRHKFCRWFEHLVDQFYVAWALFFKSFNSHEVLI